MARSTYIYIIRTEAGLFPFTVKYEAQRYLMDHGWASTDTVERHIDGYLHKQPPAVMTADAFMETGR